MAVKVSNLITKDLLTFDLKFALDQMHMAFEEERELTE